MELSGFLYTASTWAIPILVAITFHEAAHAYAAWKLGDDTAFRLGRVTFNPLKHVDPFGTVLVPALLLLFKAPFLFGWAKPVPVAFGHLSRPRRDMALVALAGPLTNVVLALASAGLFHLVRLLPEAAAAWVAQTLLKFKWSSQHLERGGCDGHSEAAFGSVRARRVALAWSALGGAA